MRNQKGVSLLKLIIVIVIIIIAVLVISSLTNNKLNDEEGMAYANLRWACSKTALGDIDNIGTITREQFNTLGKIAKEENGKWFSDVKKAIEVKISDKSDAEQIVAIKYGDYVATFTVDHSKVDYYLLDYTFEKKQIDGYLVMIED